MNKFYILCVVNDTPYHEGVEQWIRFNGKEIVQCFEDWMVDILLESEFMFYECEFDVSGGIDITEKILANINYEITAKNLKKAMRTMKFNASKLVEYPEIEDMYYCKPCDTFNTTSTCAICKSDLVLYDE
jgi:hypothetical protein